MDKTSGLSVKIVLFFVFLFAVIYGQTEISRLFLSLQLVGVAGLLYLLWDYNKHYK